MIRLITNQTNSEIVMPIIQFAFHPRLASSQSANKASPITMPARYAALSLKLEDRNHLHEHVECRRDQRYPGSHCFSFETIGMSMALVRSFIGTYNKIFLAFDLHGVVNHDADQF